MNVKENKNYIFYKKRWTIHKLIMFGETGSTISFDINEDTLDGHEDFVNKIKNDEPVAKRVKTIVCKNEPIKVIEDEKTQLVDEKTLIHEVEEEDSDISDEETESNETDTSVYTGDSDSETEEEDE